jgi:uncharacterized protein YggE
MRTRHLLLATLLITSSFSGVSADELAPNNIVASGNAEILTNPDRATIDIGVVNSAPGASAALRANNLEMARVVAAIRGIGIQDSAMQTSNFAIEAQHPQDKNGRSDDSRTIGYEITNKLTITVGDLSKVAEIIDAAVKAGANSSNSVSFDVKNRSTIDDQVLADAVRDARHHAEIMAAAEHVKVGRVISITETTSSGGMMDNISAGYKYEGMPTPILAGQIPIDARVTVVFAIE